MLLSDHIRRDSDFWLKWLVELYGKEVSKLGRSDIDRLASEVERFCQNYSSQSEFKIPVTLVRKHLKKLHGQLAEMLESLIPVPSKVWEKPRGRIGVTLWVVPCETVQIELFRRVHILKERVAREPQQEKGNLSWAEHQVLKGQAKWEKEALSFTDGSIGSSYSAGWPSIFWLAVTEVLKENGHRLWRCIVCGQLFIKKKRQTYCSPQCSQKMRSERWYHGHKDEAREKQREVRKRRKKNELGFPNLKVGRSNKKS